MEQSTLAILVPIGSCLAAGLFWLLGYLHTQKPVRTSRKLESRLQQLKPYSRSILYGIAVVWALLLYARAAFHYQETETALSELMRDYGLTAVFMLFATFIPGLTRVFFPNATIKGMALHLRRALGVTTFFFAFLHATIGFLHNLSASLEVLSYLSARHMSAIVLSLTALIILAVLAGTSFDKVWQRMGNTLKRIHRLVYAAALMILAHIILIGSDFTVLTGWLPILTLALALTIFELELLATILETRRKNTLSSVKNRLIADVLIVILVAAPVAVYVLLRPRAVDPHAGHAVVQKVGDWT